jgi:hypothetical protein
VKKSVPEFYPEAYKAVCNLYVPSKFRDFDWLTGYKIFYDFVTSVKKAMVKFGYFIVKGQFPLVTGVKDVYALQHI